MKMKEKTYCPMCGSENFDSNWVQETLELHNCGDCGYKHSFSDRIKESFNYAENLDNINFELNIKSIDNKNYVSMDSLTQYFHILKRGLKSEDDSRVNILLMDLIDICQNNFNDCSLTKTKMYIDTIDEIDDCLVNDKFKKAHKLIKKARETYYNLGHELSRKETVLGNLEALESCDKDVEIKIEKFLDWYKEKHKYCPKCGSEDFKATRVKYKPDELYLEKYQDKNNCECLDCGFQHLAHDRVENKNEKDKKGS